VLAVVRHGVGPSLQLARGDRCDCCRNDAVHRKGPTLPPFQIVLESSRIVSVMAAAASVPRPPRPTAVLSTPGAARPASAARPAGTVAAAQAMGDDDSSDQPLDLARPYQLHAAAALGNPATVLRVLQWQIAREEQLKAAHRKGPSPECRSVSGSASDTWLTGPRRVRLGVRVRVCVCVCACVCACAWVCVRGGLLCRQGAGGGRGP
jgi:hypothetical protein